MKLLQVSDPHFGTTQPAVTRALQQFAQRQKPDVLVLSGDITQRASAEQFAEARTFCDSLAIPRMLSLPGNHDIALFNVFERLFRPYARYLQAFGPQLETTIELPQLLVTGVNTTRPWRHKDGEVSAAQISRVARVLAMAAPDQLRIVVVHQPVHVLRPKDEHDRLHNWEPAVRAWTDAGADVIMGGHIHLPYVCELTQAVNNLKRRSWCVQAGTALSSRVRQGAPNSVNLLRYEPGNEPASLPQCHVEQWDHIAATAEFECVKKTLLALDRRPAL